MHRFDPLLKGIPVVCTYAAASFLAKQTLILKERVIKVKIKKQVSAGRIGAAVKAI